MNAMTTEEVIADVGAIIGLIPQLIALVAQWRQGKITADEATAQATVAVAALMSSLRDPQADAAATNAAVDAEAKTKFGGQP